MADENDQVVVPENNDAPAPADAPKDDKIPLSPEAEKRINKIYKELKSTKERNSLLEDHLVKLTNAVSKMDERTKTSEIKSVMTDLKTQIREARDLGNTDLEEKLQDQLTDLLLEEKLAKKMPKPAPAPQPVADAYTSLSPKEERMVGNWAEEVDEDGEPLRPWAQNAKHPKAQEAYEYLTNVLDDPEYDDLTIKEKLALVDEKYLRKPKATRDVNAVGPGSLTNNKNEPQDKLSDAEKQVAWRIFSKLSREEAEKKYLAGKKAMNG